MLFIKVIVILYIIFFICFCCKLCYVLYKEHKLKKKKLYNSRLEMNMIIESKYYVQDGEFGRLPSIMEVDEYINSDGEFTDSDEEDELSQNNV